MAHQTSEVNVHSTTEHDETGIDIAHIAYTESNTAFENGQSSIATCMPALRIQLASRSIWWVNFAIVVLTDIVYMIAPRRHACAAACLLEGET